MFNITQIASNDEEFLSVWTRIQSQVQSDEVPLPTDILLRTQTLFNRVKTFAYNTPSPVPTATSEAAIPEVPAVIAPATKVEALKKITTKGFQSAKVGLQNLWKGMDLFVTSLAPPIPTIIWGSKNKEQKFISAIVVNDDRLAKMKELREEAKKLILKYKTESVPTTLSAPVPLSVEEDLYDGSYMMMVTEKKQLLLDLKIQITQVYWELLLVQHDIIHSIIQNLQGLQINAEEKILLVDLEQMYLDSLTQISLLTNDEVIKEDKFQAVVKTEIAQWMGAIHSLRFIYSRIENENKEVMSVEAQLKEVEKTSTDLKQLAALRSHKAQVNKTALKTKLFLKRHQIEMVDRSSNALQQQALAKSLPMSSLTDEENATLSRLKEIKQDCFTKSQELFEQHKKEDLNHINFTILPEDEEKEKLREMDLFEFVGPLNHVLNKPLNRLPGLLSKLNQIGNRSEEELLNQKIDDIDTTVLSPSNLLLSNKEEQKDLSWWQKARNLLGDQIKVILKSNFNSTLTSLQVLKQSLKLKIKQEEIRLQQNQATLSKGATQEFLFRLDQSTKNAAIIGLERELSVINLSITHAKIIQLLDTLGHTQHIIKEQKKTIEANKKLIGFQDQLMLLCNSLAEVDLAHTLNPATSIPHDVDTILDTVPPEVQILFKEAVDTLDPFPLDKKEAYDAIRSLAERNKVKLKLENSIIQKKIEEQDASVTLLRKTYKTLMKKYEELYSEQPILSFKDALSAETKNILTHTISLSFISNRIPHANELRYKYRYAILGYSMEHEVLRFLEKLKIDPAKGETWQSVLEEEVKNFMFWAEKHPSTSANLASDIAQVWVLIRSTLDRGQAFPPVIELFSALKAKIYTHAFLGTLGRSEFDPDDEENELRYRALADLIRYAPVAFATIKGTTQAFNADTLQGMIIGGIRGALTNVVISHTIQQFVDSIPLIKTETWLRSLRIVFNTVLRNDLYVDSVVEQKNIQFIGFMSEIKQAFLHPQSVPKDISNRLWRWWRSFQNAKGSEKTMRLVIQMGIPVFGVSALMATYFMMTTPGTFLATWIFGGNVGLFSAFGITGFVAFCIYQAAYNFGHYLSANFTETQRLVRREEAKALFKKYKTQIDEHVNSYITELRSRAILPFLEPLGPLDKYPLAETRKYEEIEITVIQDFTKSLDDMWRDRVKEKMKIKAPLTMKDCIHIFNKLRDVNLPLEEADKTTKTKYPIVLETEEEKAAKERKAKAEYPTLFETMKAKAAKEIKAKSHFKELDEDILKHMSEIVAHNVLVHLENEWLKPLMKKSYKEVLMRLYVDSFVPAYENAESAQKKSPEATLKQIFEGIEPQIMEPVKAQEWSMILSDTLSGLQRMMGLAPTVPPPTGIV